MASSQTQVLDSSPPWESQASSVTVTSSIDNASTRTSSRVRQRPVTKTDIRNPSKDEQIKRVTNGKERVASRPQTPIGVDDREDAVNTENEAEKQPSAPKKSTRKAVTTTYTAAEIYRLIHQMGNKHSATLQRLEEKHEEQIAVLSTQIESLKEQLSNVKQEIIKEIKEQVSEIKNNATKETHPAVQSYARALGSQSALPSIEPVNSQTLAQFHKEATIEPLVPAQRPDLRINIDTADTGTPTSPEDLRNRIEKAIQAIRNNPGWTLHHLQRQWNNHRKFKIIARDAIEVAQIRGAFEGLKREGERIRDEQLYPVRVDGVYKFSILDGDEVQENAAKVMSEANKLDIKKIHWISRRDPHKAYGSMILYLASADEQRKALQNQFVQIKGESAPTKVYEKSNITPRCYKCQEFGHKAIHCRGEERCGKCAMNGHNSRECNSPETKCCHCNGPHAVWTRDCPKIAELSRPRHL